MNVRLLIVDDNEVNRRVLREQVTAWGMRNDSLESGTETTAALSRACEEGDPYDFLLLDYHMPVMDGAAVTASVRSTPAIRDVPIIMLTSLGHRGSSDAFVDACLTKPVRQSHLLNTLAATRAVRLHRSAQGSSGARRGAGENAPGLAKEFTGLRVLVGRRVGSSYTSDLSSDGIRELVKSAMELAAISTEDPHAGLPEPSELGALPGDLQLFSADIAGTNTDYRIEQARQTEEAAFSADPRITNSEGASFDAHSGKRVFANSRGFSGSYRVSSCSLSTTPVARQGEFMERDYWYSSARKYSNLQSPTHIGRCAAERTVRRLGARKVSTQKVPVIFDPQTARTLLANIFDAVEGDAIYRSASFLAGKLGDRVASESVTIVDDGTLPGLFGTSPFDDEGVPSRRTVVIDRGVLKSYLLNAYTARKLGLKTTGNAARGITGMRRSRAARSPSCTCGQITPAPSSCTSAWASQRGASCTCAGSSPSASGCSRRRRQHYR